MKITLQRSSVNTVGTLYFAMRPGAPGDDAVCSVLSAAKARPTAPYAIKIATAPLYVTRRGTHDEHTPLDPRGDFHEPPSLHGP